MRPLPRILLAALALWLALALLPARAAGPEGLWLPLLSPRCTEGVRVTFYGPRYGAGDVCASGLPYVPDGRFVALGPSLLRQARALSGEEWPVVALEVGGRVELLPVWDTGSAAHGYELEVDLPDVTWRVITGRPAEEGVVLGAVWVWAGGEAIGWRTR